MDGLKCEKCGEQTTDEDQVCQSCGFFVDDWNFQPDAFQTLNTKDQRKSSTFKDFGPSRLYLKVNKQSKSGLRSPGFKYGMDVLRNLCHTYTISKDQQTNIESLFQGVYLARHYRHRNAIETMVGCCVHHVLNMNNISVSLTDLCLKLKCDKKTFYRNKKYFDNWYKNKTVNDVPKEALSSPDKNCNGTEQILRIPNLNETFRLPSTAESHIDSVFINFHDEDKLLLVEKTKQLVKLANACWVYEGRNPKNVVVACAFLCWKAANLGRRKTTFREFHSELSLSGPSRGYDVRIAEITNILLQLGCKIPTYSSNNITSKNVLYHLNYILENFQTLCNDLFKEVMSQEGMEHEKYDMFRIKPIPNKETLNTSPVEEYDSSKEDEPLDDEELSNYILSPKQKALIDKIYALK